MLAAGWQTVRQVSDLLAEVSAKAGMRVEVVGVHAAREEEMKIKTTLINGVDVLVATPSSLLSSGLIIGRWMSLSAFYHVPPAANYIARPHPAEVTRSWSI